MYFVSLHNQSETVNTNQNINEQTSGVEELVYTSNDNTYQITFPEGWEVDDSGGGTLAAFYDPIAQLQFEATELYMGMKMEIYVDHTNPGDTVESYINDLVEATGEDLLEQTNVIVDGEPAIKLKMDVLGYSIATYVVKDDHIFIIAGYIGNGDDISKYTAKYSGIVDSMEFLDLE